MGSNCHPGETTARHDAMHVRTMRECRAPGVQHQGDTDACAQVLGIGGMVSKVSATAANSRPYTAALFW